MTDSTEEEPPPGGNWRTVFSAPLSAFAIRPAGPPIGGISVVGRVTMSGDIAFRTPPVLATGALLDYSEKTAEGTLVHSVTAVWQQAIQYLASHPEEMNRLGWREWEEATFRERRKLRSLR